MSTGVSDEGSDKIVSFGFSSASYSSSLPSDRISCKVDVFQHTPAVACHESESHYAFSFMIAFLNLKKSLPCSGLVKKSAVISPVGQYSTDNSLLLIRSLMK